MTSREDFAAAPHARGRGKVGETAAARYLESQGFEIVARNAVTKVGEIDLVAREGETLCFVEIKARSSDRYGPAIGAVNAPKQRRLARAAAMYLALHRWNGPCRFDVLGLDARDDGTWQFTLLRDAFRL